MRVAADGRCVQCLAHFRDGEMMQHMHLDGVVSLFHPNCVRPWAQSRYASPVGAPMPCDCDLTPGAVVDQELFGVD